MMINYRLLVLLAYLLLSTTELPESTALAQKQAPATLTTTRAVLKYGGAFAEANECDKWEARMHKAKRDCDEGVMQVSQLLRTYEELCHKLKDWHLEPEHPLRLRLLPAAKVESPEERALVTSERDLRPGTNAAVPLHVRQLDTLVLLRDALQSLAPEAQHFASAIEQLAEAESVLAVNAGTNKWRSGSDQHVSSLLKQLAKPRARDRILQGERSKPTGDRIPPSDSEPEVLRSPARSTEVSPEEARTLSVMVTTGILLCFVGMLFGFTLAKDRGRSQ